MGSKKLAGFSRAELSDLERLLTEAGKLRLLREPLDISFIGKLYRMREAWFVRIPKEIADYYQFSTIDRVKVHLAERRRLAPKGT